jgi:hypothetical protein
VNAWKKADRRLPEELTRLYFLGWAGISPLVLIAGLIALVSYDFTISALLTGLWAGILNLGILWSGIFSLIVVGRLFVGLALRLSGPGKQKPKRTGRPFLREFGEAWALGWTILLVVGFVAEFLAHTRYDYGGLFMVLAFGFIPMTLAAVLLAYFRSRA